MRHAFLWMILAALISSCEMLPRDNYYGSPESSGFTDSRRGATNFNASIFAGDSAVATDAEIAKALDYVYDPSRITSIALVQCGSVGRELIGTQADIFAQILEVNPGLELVRIPNSLMPRELSAAHLRSLAARLQADTVILYEFQKNFTYDEKFFSRDTAKFWVTLEYYIFDTRSGIIPHSNAFDQVTETKKSDGTVPWEYVDENFRQISRALIQELAEDLRKVSTSR